MTGDYLKDALKFKNMTQAELARATGLDPSRVSKLISGKMKVSAYIAVRLEQAIPEIPARQWLQWVTDDELREARSWRE